jgi:hypothetical protein
MFNRKLGLVCLIGISFFSGLAYAADDNEEAPAKNWHVTLSGKLWANNWNGWTNTTSSGTTSIVASGVPVIGGVTVRYKNYFISGNFSPSTTYDFSAYTGEGKYKRREFDINGGYYIVPQVALAIGYKEVDMEYSANSTWKYKFGIIGVNGASQINDTKAFMYGNGAFGIGKVTSTYPPFAGYGAGNPTYESMEAGFGFTLAKNLIGTLGYKYQQISLSFSGSPAKARDITTGYILGVAYTF